MLKPWFQPTVAKSTEPNPFHCVSPSKRKIKTVIPNIVPAVYNILESIRPLQEESPASSSASPSLDNLRPPNPTPPPQDIQPFPSPTATRPPQLATPQDVPPPAFQPTTPAQATSSQNDPLAPFQSAKASPAVAPASTREFFSRHPQDATPLPSQPAPSFTPQPTPSITPAR